MKILILLIGLLLATTCYAGDFEAWTIDQLDGNKSIGSGQLLFPNGSALDGTTANILKLIDGTHAQTFQVYESYTDAANYIGGSIDAGVTTASTLTIKGITAGSGADDVHIALAPAGDGLVKIHGTASQLVFANGQYLNGSSADLIINAWTGYHRFNDFYTAGTGQSLNIKILTEETTILAAATTDTAIQIPANAIVFGVSVRVTTVIPTAATFTVIGTTTSTIFNTAAVLVAAGTTNIGTLNCPYNNVNAQTIRITPNAQPGAATGKVRVTIHFYDITAPTS